MISPPFKNLKYWQLGSISSNIFFVKKGIRPVSQFTIRKEWVDEIIIEIKKNHLYFLKINIDENYDSLYIFKYLYLENIIKFVNSLPYNKDILNAWIDGKMFGYSDEEIERYIKLGNIHL